MTRPLAAVPAPPAAGEPTAHRHLRLRHDGRRHGLVHTPTGLALDGTPGLSADQCRQVAAALTDLDLSSADPRVITPQAEYLAARVDDAITAARTDRCVTCGDGIDHHTPSQARDCLQAAGRKETT